MQTIEKLTICARRCGQSTPKVVAIFCTCPPLLSIASMANAFITAFHPAMPRIACPTSPASLPDQEQRVEDNRFCERDREDRLNQNLCRGVRITSHGF